MTTHDRALPNEIKATIHGDAIQRVSRFFDASFEETLNELFQNARRAGASKVEVTIEGNRVTVTDDGSGIADPGAILAFGLSDWDQDTTRREDPAGMGIYALARKENIVITSRHQDAGEGWRVQLVTGHFTGETAAPVEKLPGDQAPPGTSVAFDDANARESIVWDAAKYYPVPVTLNGKEVERRDYLQGTVYRDDWRGLRIGVKKEGRRQPYHYGKANFHGITLNVLALPEISSIDNTWYVLIDVVDCPELELTLPARKDLVKTPFVDEMVRACRAAIYRAMLADPGPVDLPRAKYDEAHALGVNVPEARPLLKPWAPLEANSRGSSRITGQPRGPIADKVLVMDAELEVPDQQALSRALRNNDLEHRMWEADQRMAGYGWYDRLDKVTEVAVSVEAADGTVIDLKEARASEEMPFDEMAQSITFILTVTGQGQDERTVEVPTDLAFFDTEPLWFEDCHKPIVTKVNRLDVSQLSDLLMESYFDPEDDAGVDSYETQQAEHEAHFLRMARSLLVSEEEAVLKAVQAAVNRHVRYQLPQGWTANIDINPKGAVEVSLTPAE